MDGADAEGAQLRREILDDVGALLRAELAADEWGRLRVEVVRGQDGEPTVAGIDVEEIVGDEARVDAIFGSSDMRAVLPVLAKAAEALCGIDGVSLEDVQGGTFVRLGGGGFAWLPGLVRAPSARFDAERDALLAKLRSLNDALATELGIDARANPIIDLAQGSASFSPRGRPSVRARATLIGTFAPASRTWGWGGSNPHSPEACRRASERLTDAVPERDMWELSTPLFPTDEPTAWGLAALVCDRSGGKGVFCDASGAGLVFLLLDDVEAV